MPAISFSGTTSRGPFYDLILKKEKCQTCREPRKRPIRVGPFLRLYWLQRVPRNKKPIHLIASAQCIEVKRIRLIDVWNDEAFAKADGFGSLEEFRDWFYPDWRIEERFDSIHPHYADLNPANTLKAHLTRIEYDVIKWSKNLIGQPEWTGVSPDA